MKLLSVIIPCYNEEEMIPIFMEEMRKIEASLHKDLCFEYLFVNDGSSDATLQEIRKVHQKYPNVHYLSFSKNFGKEAGILAGLEEAKGDLVTIMDSDLQDPPELIPLMYQKIQNGYDVVVACRSDRQGEPQIRSFLSKTFYWLINRLSTTEIKSGVRDFRLMTREVVDAILSLKEVNRFSKGIFSWIGYEVTYVNYVNRQRKAGKTKWNFFSLLKYSIDGFVNFSEIPLNISTWIGVISFVLSLLAIFLIVIRKLFWQDPVSGWASTVSIILMFGGIQLFCMGIMGKYIAKIFTETKKRPVYIIKEKA